MAPFVPRKCDDPDFKYYNWEKSHNSKFYKKTPGVCTTVKDELQAIFRTTANGPGHSVTKLPEDPKGDCRSKSKLQRDCMNNNRIDDEITNQINGDGDMKNQIEVDNEINNVFNDEAPQDILTNSTKKKRKRKKRFLEKKKLRKQRNMSKYCARGVERDI